MIRIRRIDQMKLSPNIWGPVFWHTIHITALGYPNDPSYTQKRAAKEFYESLAHLIPCPVCREHYKQHLEKMPLSPHLDRRADLFRWTVELHNQVNKSLGKPRVSETESILYYKRLGIRDKTIIITQDHLDEVDLRSMLRGAAIGGGIIFTAGALLWYTTRS